MNEATTPQTGKTPRRAKAPRALRQIDAGIAAIHAETREKVSAYRSKQVSTRILATILNKRLPGLTPDDRIKLFDALRQQVTPPLPLSLSETFPQHLEG